MRQGLEVDVEFNRLMRNDCFDAIPEARAARGANGALARLYHDVGLAAVAEALGLPAENSEPEMIESLDRREPYPVPPNPALAHAGRMRK